MIWGWPSVENLELSSLSLLFASQCYFSGICIQKSSECWVNDLQLANHLWERQLVALAPWLQYKNVDGDTDSHFASIHPHSGFKIKQSMCDGSADFQLLFTVHLSLSWFHLPTESNSKTVDFFFPSASVLECSLWFAPCFEPSVF